MKQQYYDIFGSRKVRDVGKSYWFRVGRAFPNPNGSITVRLDAIPAPTDGQFKLTLFLPEQVSENEE